MSTQGASDKPKLLEQVRWKIRLQNYSYQTEKSYLQWIKRYILFHQKRHPLEMGKPEVETFLTYLAVERNVAASTQNQALSALIFLYKHVLDSPLGFVEVLWAKKPVRLPIVLTSSEVQQLLTQLDGEYLLIVQLLYGAGLRLNECLNLRVKDIDFGQGLVFVRDGKGKKDRSTPLPERIVTTLKTHLRRVQHQHHADLQHGNGRAPLPNALKKKYPNAETEWIWQFVFPSRTLSTNPRGDKTVYRYHLHESSVSRAIKRAATKANLKKRVSAHTFRHSFATHLLERGVDIRTIQTLMGHKNLNTTMIYTHVINRGAMGVSSPLDSL